MAQLFLIPGGAADLDAMQLVVLERRVDHGAARSGHDPAAAKIFRKPVADAGTAMPRIDGVQSDGAGQVDRRSRCRRRIRWIPCIAAEIGGCARRYRRLNSTSRATAATDANWRGSRQSNGQSSSAWCSSKIRISMRALAVSACGNREHMLTMLTYDLSKRYAKCKSFEYQTFSACRLGLQHHGIALRHQHHRAAVRDSDCIDGEHADDRRPFDRRQAGLFAARLAGRTRASLQRRQTRGHHRLPLAGGYFAEPM